MVRADTSIWIDHLREGDPHLERLLMSESVFTHPMVIGEVAMGSIRNRRNVLTLMRSLPKIQEVEHEEVMMAVEAVPIFGRGAGFVDAHLLTATRANYGCSLWTRDRRLHAVAAEMGIAYTERMN